ncbi:hypothetical protein [Dyadobacter bucti]|uniref:hypothetical protein n=1 Tax=Dyadobacter bucti TaxID=2572203 RepID=UPI001107E0EC|nr:hypothetical protein [Dyadobacter bucti]
MNSYRLISIPLLSLIVFLTFGCGSPSKSVSENSNAITNEEISGEYKGSISIDDGDYISAIKMEIKENGTFTAQRFVNGKEKEMFAGSYKTIVEKIVTKDSYGKDTTPTYFHTVNFITNDKNPQSTYIINDGYKTKGLSLAAFHSYLDHEIELNRVE